MLFENIYGNTCGWKNTLKCMKYCLKTENDCLETQTKHPLSICFDKQWLKIKLSIQFNSIYIYHKSVLFYIIDFVCHKYMHM